MIKIIKFNNTKNPVDINFYGGTAADSTVLMEILRQLSYEMYVSHEFAEYYTE